MPASSVKATTVDLIKATPVDLIKATTVDSLFETTVYTSPRDLPESVWKYWRNIPYAANVQHPIAKKFLLEEQKSGVPVPDQCWIVLQKHANGPIEFVLSCTTGAVGNYPIFITSSKEYASNTIYPLPQMKALAEHLIQIVPSTRVYSIFAPEHITHPFVFAWTNLTGIWPYQDPYYAAKLTYCTKDTLSRRQATIPPYGRFLMGKADDRDIAAVAELCYGFAKESVSHLSLSGYHCHHCYDQSMLTCPILLTGALCTHSRAGTA
jgi:hypothetical protein